MTATTISKTDELAALRQLIDHLGPDSYLGPWLADAIDYLAADIRADIRPASPADQYRAASEWRLDTERVCRQMRDEARLALDKAHATAGAITGAAEIDAERIRGRVWQQIHQIQKELER
jgi:hypothetical protein